MKFDGILEDAVKVGASDVHLKVGVVPVVRRHGLLQPLSSKSTPITPQDMESYLSDALSNEEKTVLTQEKELDKGYHLKSIGRFRINVFRQRGTTRFVVRVISKKIPPLESLQLPSVVQKIAESERGLVLVTGVTGSGKSTTLASMIDHINRNSHKHIVTLEDPIEYFIQDRKSIISQRELGRDMNSFSNSLRACLRQDPDVIFVGEMRDLATMETAILAAETGHLVFSTLHTIDAMETVNRVIAQFPGEQQDQVRRQLATVLTAVISQRLLARKDGNGLMPALEILVNNQRMKELIHDPNKTMQITDAIANSAKESGMRTFDQSLMKLVVNDQITVNEALKYTSHKDNFLLRLKGIQSGKGSDWQENIDTMNRVSTSFDSGHLSLDTDASFTKRSK